MKQKQKVLFIQENRDIDRRAIPVEAGKRLKLEDEKLCWQRLRELCYPIKGIGSGLHMIIDSRFSLPITPYKYLVPDETLELVTNHDEIFHEAFNDVKAMSEADRRKANNLDMLLWSLIIAVFGIVIFFFATANIDMKTLIGLK